MRIVQQKGLLWWLIPRVLAGMPMPFIHPERRMAGGGPLYAFEDELLALHAAGVRAVVSLLNIPSDAPVFPAVSESVTSRERGNTLRGVGGGNGVGSP